jgi:hypothetical protein
MNALSIFCYQVHTLWLSLCHIVKKYAPMMPAKLPKTSKYDTSSTTPAFGRSPLTGASPFLAVEVEEAILDARDNWEERAALASANAEGRMPPPDEGIEVPRKEVVRQGSRTLR